MSHSFLFFDYIRWHYSRALSSIWKIVKNFLWFFYHFFSLPLFIHTLFKPWHNLKEKPKASFTLSNLFETLVLNILMRLFGLCARLLAITLGIIFILSTLLAGIFFTLFWIVAPFVGVFSLLVGIRIIL